MARSLGSSVIWLRHEPLCCSPSFLHLGPLQRGGLRLCKMTMDVETAIVPRGNKQHAGVWGVGACTGRVFFWFQCCCTTVEGVFEAARCNFVLREERVGSGCAVSTKHVSHPTRSYPQNPCQTSKLRVLSQSWPEIETRRLKNVKQKTICSRKG